MATAPEQELILPVEPRRINLLGLSPIGMREFFVGLGEKPFRATQVLKWIHQRGIDDFESMTDVSRELRRKLADIAEIRPPEVVSDLVSKDGTRKWLIRVEGGSCVETVFIPEDGRGTLCISSQVGCSLDCSFCSTGKQGFNRDLSAAEIVGQLWLASRALGAMSTPSQRIITNVVFMGMGEPLLNFDNAVAAMQLMLDDNAYGLSKRRVTLSTAGVVPMLDRLADHVDVSLAISLHAANDRLRDELVPLNRKYPIRELLRSAMNYLDRMPDQHRKLTIEYTLIAGVNDSIEDARELALLLKEVPCKINLIPFNPFSLSDYRRPQKAVVLAFRDTLMKAGHIATVRTTRGEDIDAACGQLAGAVNDRTRRSQRYRDRAESGISLVEVDG